jgi:hypothetical protein
VGKLQETFYDLIENVAKLWRVSADYSFAAEMLMVIKRQWRPVAGIIVPENQSSVLALIVVGIVELLYFVPDIDILCEVKLRLVYENEASLDDTDLLSAVVGDELRAHNKAGFGVFVDDPGEGGRVFTQQQTQFP